MLGANRALDDRTAKRRLRKSGIRKTRGSRKVYAGFHEKRGGQKRPVRWTPLLTIPIKSGGGYKFSFKYKILEKSPSATVYAAMRSIDSDGKKNRLSLKTLTESKSAKNVVMGAVVPSSAKGEIEIISNGSARIILDDISVEKLEVDPRGAWMYDDDAFIAMRYKPTNFDFSGFDAPFLSYTKEEFFPFIDKYGQFKHKDWTDKIKSDGDFKKRAEEEKAFYEKIGDISRRDKYLGLVRDGKNYGATGRFRAEKRDHHGDQAAGNGDGNRGVDSLADAVEVPGAVALGDDYCGAGRHAHEQVDEQADEDTGGAAYGSQSHSAHIVAHNHSVSRVIELLEKGAQQDGEEESQQRAEDSAFGDLVLGSHLIAHVNRTSPRQ